MEDISLANELKKLILEAVKAGIVLKRGKTPKTIPKTVKAVLLPPPGAVTTMASTPSGMSS